MGLKPFIASLLVTSFLIHPAAPLMAGYETLEDLQKDLAFIKQHNGSLKASLDFKASANQTAAGCFNYALKDGQYHVLLGFRDDEDTWCTPGGKSKPEEETLAQTAAQEGAEESFNIYAPHPDALSRHPFVDLLTLSATPEDAKDLLFRLYFTPVEYLEADIFNSRLSPPETTALKTEHMEYRQFQWVPISDLLQATQKGSPVFKTAAGETITLFDPLYHILTTAAGQAILGHLVKRPKRPLPEKARNRLYVAGVPEVASHLATHWELPPFDPKKLHDQLYLKQNFKDALHRIGMYEDAFGRSKAVRTQAGQSRQEVFNAQKNQKILGQAVAFKAAANLELKMRGQSFGEGPEKLTTTWMPPAKTLSDRLLQLQLGKDYVAPTADTPAARRAADLVNLKKYVTLHGLKEGEMKRTLDTENTPDIERLADVLEKTRHFHQKGWIPFIHAAQPDVAFLPLWGTALRSNLTFQAFPVGSIPGLRQTDIYFRNHPSMAKSLALTGPGDYDKGNNNRRICFNMALTAGLQSTSTSSSSLEYFMNAHSVHAPHTLKCFEEAFYLLGIEDGSYLPYQGLYEQFLAYRGGKISQSALITLLVNPEILNTYAYPAFGDGDPYAYKDPETGERRIPNAVEALHLASQELDEKLEQEKARPSSPAEKPEKPIPLSEKKVNHIAEIRFLWHPDVVYDPTKIQVYKQDRFPLTVSQQRALDTKLRAFLAYDLGTWLSHHIHLFPDSFTGNPQLKKLYATAYTDLTGQAVHETFAAQAFPHLVKNGHTEGVKLFWESYPALVQSLNLAPKSLALMALKSGEKELIQYVIEEMLHTTPSALFQPSDIAASLQIALASQSISPSLQYILENYDMNLIPLTQRRFLAEYGLGKRLSDCEVLKFIHERIFPITPEFVDEFLQKERPSRLWGLVSLTHIPPIQVTDCLVKQIETCENRDKKIVLENIVMQQMKEHHLSFADLLPSTGAPLLFSALVFSSGWLETSEFVKNDPAVLNLKSQEGLTLFQYIQKCLLEGKTINFGIRYDVSEKFQVTTGQNKWKEEVYPPVLEEFGELSTTFLLYSNTNPFANPVFLRWRTQLREAIASNSFKAVKAAFEAVPDPEYLSLYELKNPTSYASKKCLAESDVPTLGLSAPDERLEKIKGELSSLVEADDYKAFFPFIDQAVSQNPYRWSFQDTLRLNFPSVYDLQERLKGDKTPPERLFVNWDLATQREEFIQKAKAGRITPSLVAFSTYFHDENIDLVKETLPFIYQDPKELLEQIVIFYALQPKILSYVVDHVGADFMLKNISELCLHGLFHSLQGQLSAIESAYPDLLTYQDGERDLLPYFIDYGGVRDIAFVKKHLKRLKETYDMDGIPLLYSVILEDEKVAEKMVQYDPSILNLASKGGILCKDIILHFYGEDSLEYQKLIVLMKKYGGNRASSANG